MQIVMFNPDVIIRNGVSLDQYLIVTFYPHVVIEEGVQLAQYLMVSFNHYFTLLYFIWGCRGEMKLTISSKPECLERGDVVCLECLFDTCNLSFSWSPSHLEACHPGVVCFEGQLVGGHAFQMSKPLDSLLSYVVVSWCCSGHVPDMFVSYHVSSGLIDRAS